MRNWPRCMLTACTRDKTPAYSHAQFTKNHSYKHAHMTESMTNTWFCCSFACSRCWIICISQHFLASPSSWTKLYKESSSGFFSRMECFTRFEKESLIAAHDNIYIYIYIYRKTHCEYPFARRQTNMNWLLDWLVGLLLSGFVRFCNGLVIVLQFG